MIIRIRSKVTFVEKKRGRNLFAHLIVKQFFDDNVLLQRLEFHSYLQHPMYPQSFITENEITPLTIYHVQRCTNIDHTGLETSLFRCKNTKRKKQAGIDKLTIFLREIITIFCYVCRTIISLCSCLIAPGVCIMQPIIIGIELQHGLPRNQSVCSPS